jgi:putative hydrolase of the HAD superfamily
MAPRPASSLPPRLPRPLRGVFLDAGDTLLCPWPSFHERFQLVAQEHGVRFELAEVEAAWVTAIREALWPEDWTDPATQRQFWHGFYLEVLRHLPFDGDAARLAEAAYEVFSDPATYRLFDDSRPALEALAARGLTLGVISNFEPWLRDVLALQQVDHLFATVTISGVIGIAKPDPGIFHAALDTAGVRAGEALYVGDQPEIDAKAAEDVGMTPVLIDRFGRRPEPLPWPRITSLTELVDLLDQDHER